MTQDTHDDIPAAKATMRAAARTRRDQLSPENRAAASSAIASHGLGLTGIRAPAVVSGYLGIGSEVNTRPLFERLLAEGYSLALPVMNGRDQPLLFRAWRPGAPLEQKVWGIREPAQCAPLVTPDVVLTALLAFDHAGWRLGWGGGYFDRSIRALRSHARPVIVIGLAYDEQKVDAVPHLDYDERLDWVLTPSGPVRCRP